MISQLGDKYAEQLERNLEGTMKEEKRIVLRTMTWIQMIFEVNN